ncbi:hypothetical protein [Paracidovorax wautersii]|uniref:hypothetical protein n=1 Tax=Paracidovorax wautersii TaxID=1177982 RepID=UPI0031DBA3A0
MNTWIIIILACLVAFVGLWTLAMCRAAGRADAAWEDFIAGGWSEMSLRPSEPPSKSFQTENAGGCRASCRSGLLEALAEPANPAVRIASSLGAMCGIVGALMLAMQAMQGWGFMAFALSNVAWLIASRMQRQTALHLQQWVFLGCSLVGLWNWWLGPLVLG